MPICIGGWPGLILGRDTGQQIYASVQALNRAAPRVRLRGWADCYGLSADILNVGRGAGPPIPVHPTLRATRRS